MKGFKDVDKLSISDCCSILGIDKKDLPNILENAHFSMEQQPIADRLKLLISRDKSTFYSCSNIEQYEMYLSLWPDGLFHDAARQKVAQLRIETEELAFYKKNKNSLSGCKAYLQKYPNGKFANDVQSLLTQKKNNKNTRNLTLCVLIVILFVIGGIYSYESLPIIDIPEEIYVSQYGDTIDFKSFIRNEVDDKNIQFKLNDINLEYILKDEGVESNLSNYSVIYRNDHKDAYILSDIGHTASGSSEYMSLYWSNDISINRKYIIPMNTSTNKITKEVDIISVSRIFGFVLNKDIKTIKIEQAAGEAKYLDIQNISSEWNYNVLSTKTNLDNNKIINLQVSNNGIRGNSFPVFFNTDGTFIKIENSDRSWISIEKRGDCYGNNFNFHIRALENRNSFPRNGTVTFSCGNKIIKIVLNQESGNATYFDIEDDDIYVRPEAVWEEGDDIFDSHYSVRIETDGIWNFRQSEDSRQWLKVVKSVYDDKLDFQVKENNSYYERIAKISITTLNKGTKEITIVQRSAK